MSGPLDLDPIKERLAAISPGDWDVAHHYTWDGDYYSSEVFPSCTIGGDGEGGVDSVGDAEFIANAPSDVAALVEEVERLRGELGGESE